MRKPSSWRVRTMSELCQGNTIGFSNGLKARFPSPRNLQGWLIAKKEDEKSELESVYSETYTTNVSYFASPDKGNAGFSGGSRWYSICREIELKYIYQDCSFWIPISPDTRTDMFPILLCIYRHFCKGSRRRKNAFQDILLKCRYQQHTWKKLLTVHACSL